MALSRARQREIMRADAKRRNARDIEDFLALKGNRVAPAGIDPYLFSRSIRGVPSENNRQHRASENCWTRGMMGRTVGVAPGTTVDTFTVPTVAVTINGETTVRNVSEYRRTRNVRTRAQNVDVQNRVDAQHHVTAADLAPIGNVE